MNREDLNRMICNIYSAQPEYLWKSAPSFAVYRHDSNKKWFAIIMDISKQKLGFSEDESVSVVNIKVDPSLVGTLLENEGIFPAYHMNKRHWVTVLLDENATFEKIGWLIEMSYDNTRPNVERKHSDIM